MPPFSFTPQAAPNISFGNVAGDTGQAISDFVGGLKKQQMQQQEMAMQQALLSERQRHDQRQEDLLWGSQSDLNKSRAGLVNTQNNTLTDDRGRINAGKPTLTTSGGTSTGSPGANPVNQDLKDKASMESELNQIEAGRTAWHKLPSSMGASTEQQASGSDWVHANPQARMREIQLTQNLDALYVRHPEWGVRTKHEPAGPFGPSKPGGPAGPPPPQGGPAQQPSLLKKGPTEDWTAYGTRLKAAGVPESTATRLFGQNGYTPGTP